MKLYAHHEADGSIISFYTLHAKDGFGMQLIAKEGSLVSEISGFALPSGGIKKLTTLSKTHKVDVSSGKATLTKK